MARNDLLHRRVVLDLQGCQSEVSRGRGIGRYSSGLATALLRDPRTFSISIALNGAFAEAADEICQAFGSLVLADRAVRYDAPKPNALWDPAETDVGRIAGEWIARDAWIAEKPDLVHVSSLFEGLEGNAVVPALIDIPPGTVVSATAFDVIPLLFADVYLSDERTRRWYQSRIDRMRRCDLLLAISEATRRDVIERVGVSADRIVSISGAADARFRVEEVPDERRRHLFGEHAIVRPYVMYTGGIEPRKNVEALIRAFGLLPAELRNAHQLAIICSVRDADRARLALIARRSGLRDDALVLTGYVDDDRLADLYRCCRLFVFPSLYEGFGLPVLEAMACGAPTIAADTSSLPEIVERQDALFAAGSDEAIAQAIARALSDADLRESLRRHASAQAQRFSWERTAALATDAWSAAIARRSAPTLVAAGARRPRLAMVAPLHPEASGIADFVTEWLPHLARHFEIDLFCAPPADRERYRAMGFATQSWEALLACWRDYDAGVLYQMGNSEFHVHMLALMHACPGAVLLHDAYLSGLIDYCETGAPHLRDLFRDMLAYCHPGVAYADAERSRLIEEQPMSRWVADHALGVIVTSEHALAVLRERGQIDRARCAVVPHHRAARDVSADEAAAARRALGIPAADFVVCTFGRAAKRKLSIELADAWAKGAAGDAARLCFVGDADDDYGRSLRAHAHGANGISITGYVDDATFRRYMQAADLVVQLRAGSRGEASGAALYAMAYGIPLVASRHGSLAEIAPDACVHVDLPIDVDALARTIDELRSDAGRRRALGALGKEWIRRHADPQETAALLAAHVARFNDRRYAAVGEVPPLVRDAVATPGAKADWALDTARRAARSRSPRARSDLAATIRRKLESLLPLRGSPAHPTSGAVEAWRSIVLTADDPRLTTACGVKADGVIRASGSGGGMLMGGPRLAIPAGAYRVRVYGACNGGGVNATLEIVSGAGGRRLASRPLFDENGAANRRSGLLSRLDFAIAEPLDDLEVRIVLLESSDIAIESLDVVRLDHASFA